MLCVLVAVGGLLNIYVAYCLDGLMPGGDREREGSMEEVSVRLCVFVCMHVCVSERERLCACVRMCLCMSVCACMNERERGYPVSYNF